MESTLDKQYWENILEKYSSYKGSLIDFCRENNITKHQLYYYKKKFKNENNPVFHAIALKPALNTVNVPRACKDIRIEIGKANIFIPSSETELIKTILKELKSIC